MNQQTSPALKERLERDAELCRDYGIDDNVAQDIEEAIKRIHELESALFRLRRFFDYPMNERREFVPRIDATLSGDHSKSRPLVDGEE